jgi:hypothetical protein
MPATGGARATSSTLERTDIEKARPDNGLRASRFLLDDIYLIT